MFDDLEELDLENPNFEVVYALTQVALKVHSCAVLGVGLPTAIIEARDILKQRLEENRGES